MKKSTQIKMKVQTLFSSHSKPVLQKPAYIKAKHRTYRQLLALDKPKRKVELQSDDENDDFLNKILKEEGKKQKRQSANKKKQNKPTSPTKRQVKKQDQSKQNTNTLNLKNMNNKNNKNVYKDKDNDNDNNNDKDKDIHANINLVDLVEKQKQLEKQLQMQRQRQIKKGQTFQEGQKIQAKHQTDQTDNKQSSTFDGKNVRFKYSEKQKKSTGQIYIDETSTQKYRLLEQQNKVVKHNFFNTLKVKNMQGTTLLRARTHANLHNFTDEITNNNNNKMTANPEFNATMIKNRQIQHHVLKLNRFASTTDHKSTHKNASQKYRNVVLRLAMMQIQRIDKPLDPSKYSSGINNQKLFRNQNQQKLFLKSLQKQ